MTPAAEFYCDACKRWDAPRVTNGDDRLDRCDKCHEAYEEDRMSSGPGNDDWLSAYYGGSGAQTDTERVRVAASFKRALDR